LTITTLDQRTGEPVEGAAVSIFDPEDANTGDSYIAQGTSDNGGKLSAAVTPGREYRVSVTREGYIAGESSIRVDSPEAGLTLHLTASGAITYHIIDNTTGNPIGGVYVDVANDDHERVSWGRTDSSGTYTTDELPSAEYSFIIYQNGHLYVEDSIALIGPTEMTFRLDLFGPDPARSAGLLTVNGGDSQTGETVPNATVTVSGLEEPFARIDGNSNADGVYRTEQLLSHGSYRVDVAAEGYDSVTVWTTIDGDRIIDVVLNPEPADPTAPVTPEPTATPIETVTPDPSETPAPS